MESGELFQDKNGLFFYYTGESGGEPNPNDPTSFRRATEEAPTSFMDDVSAVGEDLGRVAWNVASSSQQIFSTLGNLAGVKEEKMNQLMADTTKSLFGAIPLPESVTKKLQDSLVDPTTGRARDVETAPGQVVEVGSFLTGVGAVKGMLGKGSSKLGEAGRWLAAEQAAEQLLADPDENVSNFLQEIFPETLENNPVFDYLSADEDDSILEKRAKMALSSALVGGSIAGSLETVKGGLKVTGYAANKTGKVLKDLSKTETGQLAGDLLLVARNSDIGQKLLPRKKKLSQDDKELAEILSDDQDFFDKPFANSLRTVRQKFFSSRGYLSERGFEAQRESIQNQRAIITRAEQITNRLKKFIDEDVNSQSKEVAERIQKALTAPIADKNDKASIRYFIENFNLSPEIAEQVADARGLIDDLSETILQSGVATKETSKAIEANLGSYLRRSYKLFEEKGWKPSDTVIEDATKFIQNKTGKTPVQAKNIVNEILSSGNTQSFFDFVSTNRINTKQILSKKKEIPDEIRALMGEIKDPSENILSTVSRMAQVSENAKFFSRLKDLGENKYIFTEEARRSRPDGSSIFTAKISGTNSSLDGMYTTPKMKKAIEGNEETLGLVGKNAYYDSFLSLKAVGQKSQTVYDIQAQLRNILGGVQFGVANGLNPFEGTAKTLDILSNRIGMSGDKGFDAAYTKLQSLGVINTSVRAGDFKKLLELTEDSGVGSVLDRTSDLAEEAFGISKSTQRLPEDIYMAVDDNFKINAFYSELEILKRAKPKGRKDEKEWLAGLEKEAADIIKNTFPNYDLVPKGVKALRELPIGSFFSFPSEIIRTSYNIIRQSAKEIASGNSLLVDRGVNRLSGYVGNQAFWYNAPKITALAAGLTEEEHAAIDTLTETDYSKASKIIVRGNDKLYTLDPSFLDSYALVQDVASSLYDPIVSGELYGEELSKTLEESFFGTVSKIFEPYVDPAIFTKALFQTTTAIASDDGRSLGGQRVFDPFDDTLDRVGKSVEVIGRSLMPGAVEDLTDLVLTAVESPYVKNRYTGELPDLQTEMLSNFSGIRFREFDLDDSLTFQASVAKRERNIKTNPTVNFNITPEDIIDDYENILKNQLRANQKLYSKVNAYQQLLGLGDKYYDADLLLKNSGFSKNESEYLFYGINPAKRLTDHFFKKLTNYNIFLSPQEEERLAALYNKYNGRYLGPLEEDREGMDKGGVVEDVPRTAEEPDERIDKMTGLSYDKQAGAAFVDATDSFRRSGVDEELNRLGFREGSLAKTSKGRTIFKDDDGKQYSEKTRTYQVQDGKWVNYPTVDVDGNTLDLERIETLIEKNSTEDGVKDFVTGELLPYFDKEEVAIAAAKKRSNELGKELK